jgi:hypothetical protein
MVKCLKCGKETNDDKLCLSCGHIEYIEKERVSEKESVGRRDETQNLTQDFEKLNNLRSNLPTYLSILGLFIVTFALIQLVEVPNIEIIISSGLMLIIGLTIFLTLVIGTILLNFKFALSKVIIITLFLLAEVTALFSLLIADIISPSILTRNSLLYLALAIALLGIISDFLVKESDLQSYHRLLTIFITWGLISYIAGFAFISKIALTLVITIILVLSHYMDLNYPNAAVVTGSLILQFLILIQSNVINSTYYMVLCLIVITSIPFVLILKSKRPIKTRSLIKYDLEEKNLLIGYQLPIIAIIIGISKGGVLPPWTHVLFMIYLVTWASYLYTINNTELEVITPIKQQSKLVLSVLLAIPFIYSWSNTGFNLLSLFFGSIIAVTILRSTFERDNSFFSLFGSFFVSVFVILRLFTSEFIELPVSILILLLSISIIALPELLNQTLDQIHVFVIQLSITTFIFLSFLLEPFRVNDIFLLFQFLIIVGIMFLGNVLKVSDILKMKSLEYYIIVILTIITTITFYLNVSDSFWKFVYFIIIYLGIIGLGLIKINKNENIPFSWLLLTLGVILIFNTIDKTSLQIIYTGLLFITGLIAFMYLRQLLPDRYLSITAALPMMFPSIGLISLSIAFKIETLRLYLIITALTFYFILTIFQILIIRGKPIISIQSIFIVVTFLLMSIWKANELSTVYTLGFYIFSSYLVILQILVVVPKILNIDSQSCLTIQSINALSLILLTLIVTPLGFQIFLVIILIVMLISIWFEIPVTNGGLILWLIPMLLLLLIIGNWFKISFIISLCLAVFILLLSPLFTNQIKKSLFTPLQELIYVKTIYLCSFVILGITWIIGHISDYLMLIGFGVNSIIVILNIKLYGKRIESEYNLLALTIHIYHIFWFVYTESYILPLISNLIFILSILLLDFRNLFGSVENPISFISLKEIHENSLIITIITFGTSLIIFTYLIQILDFSIFLVNQISFGLLTSLLVITILTSSRKGWNHVSQGLTHALFLILVANILIGFFASFWANVFFGCLAVVISIIATFLKQKELMIIASGIVLISLVKLIVDINILQGIDLVISALAVGLQLIWFGILLSSLSLKK